MTKRFSIRFVLCFVAVSCVLVAVFASRRRQHMQLATSQRQLYELGVGTGTSPPLNSSYQKLMVWSGVDNIAFCDLTSAWVPSGDGMTETRFRQIVNELQYFSSLEHLDLSGFHDLSDNTIKILPAFNNLDEIDVSGTLLSKQGLDWLRQKYPDATVKN